MSAITTTIEKLGDPAGKHWCKHVTALDPSKTNGYSLVGEWVDMDRSVSVPVGAVLVAYDEIRRGYPKGGRGGRGWVAGLAAIRVMTATERGVGELERHETEDRGWALTIRPQLQALLGMDATATESPVARVERILASARFDGSVTNAELAGQIVAEVKR